MRMCVNEQGFSMGEGTQSYWAPGAVLHLI